MKAMVHEVADRLRNELRASIEDFEGLYVFGSQVRGDATEDSDIDIVLLFQQERFYQPDEYYDIMFQLGIDYYDILDFHVNHYTRDQLKLNYIFHDEVVNKGIYYGA